MLASFCILFLCQGGNDFRPASLALLIADPGTDISRSWPILSLSSARNHVAPGESLAALLSPLLSGEVLPGSNTALEEQRLLHKVLEWHQFRIGT